MLFARLPTFMTQEKNFTITREYKVGFKKSPCKDRILIILDERSQVASLMVAGTLNLGESIINPHITLIFKRVYISCPMAHSCSHPNHNWTRPDQNNQLNQCGIFVRSQNLTPVHSCETFCRHVSIQHQKHFVGNWPRFCLSIQSETNPWAQMNILGRGSSSVQNLLQLLNVALLLPNNSSPRWRFHNESVSYQPERVPMYPLYETDKPYLVCPSSKGPKQQMHRLWIKPIQWWNLIPRTNLLSIWVSFFGVGLQKNKLTLFKDLTKEVIPHITTFRASMVHLVLRQIYTTWAIASNLHMSMLHGLRFMLVRSMGSRDGTSLIRSTLLGRGSLIILYVTPSDKLLL